jgi:ferritin
MRSISSPKLLNIGTGKVPSIANNNKTKFIHECKTARLCKEMEKISKEEIIGEAQKFISDTTNENLKRKKSLNKFLMMNKTLSQVQDSKRSPNKVSYSQRLKRVLQRKKSLDESQIDGMYKKMEENTLEYRIQKKE